MDDTRSNSSVMKRIMTMSGVPSFPFRRTLGRGVDTLVDYVKDEDKNELYSLIISVASRGEGLSMDQFQTQKAIDDYLELGVNLSYRDMDNNGMIYGFSNVIPSSLSRSNAPVVHAGYVILDADYRDKGVFRDALHLNVVLALMEGYEGVLARIGVVATGGYMGTKQIGTFTTGTIPDSINIGKGIWVDDLVMYSDYYSTEPGLRRHLKEIGLPKAARNPDTSYPHITVSAVEKICHPKIDLKGCHKFSQIGQMLSMGNVRYGKHVQLELGGEGSTLVEEMIRAAAQSGEGFALDEFDNDGLLNRKFLQQSVTLVARRISDNVIIGGAVVGPSALARATEPSNLGGYVVVGEKFRRLGYGRDIIMLCERIAQRLGYRNITTDILYSPKTLDALKIALSQGYSMTGQLPQCAYMKDLGFTSSLILFKDLTQLSKL